MTFVAARIAISALAVLVLGSPVLAQGHSGVPPGQAKKVTPPAAGSHSPGAGEAPDTIAFAQPRVLGAWLDDATTIEPGSAWMSVSTSRWYAPAGRGYDAPVVDLATGLTPRLQVTLTLPYSRFSDDSGARWTGIGDTYITAKIALRSSDRGVGVAVAPTLEVSNAAVEPGADRTHWVFPVNLELRRSGWRAYGSTGYFTRGALFTAAALERALTERLFLTGTVTQSWSTGDAAAAQAYGLTRRRTDAGGGAAFLVTPALMVFGSLSRTLSAMEFDSSRLAFNLGASVRLTAR